MFGRETILNKIPAAGGCTNTVDLYNPLPDGGGVALYQLNGDATDVSGNYDGTASNVTYGAGQFGQAGVFNGSSSYVSGLPTLTNVSSEFSVSLWLKYTTNPLSGFKYVFGGIKEQGAEDSLVGIVVNDSGNIGYITRGSNSGTLHQIFSSADFTNGWHNVVIISDSTNMSLYVDGNNINTLSVSPTITVDNSVLGAINSRGTIEEHFPCSIDQVRIFNRALRPYEVEALYTEEYCTPTIVPSEHFNTVTYTGNSTNDFSTALTQSVTGVGFEPDFVWIKNRNSTYPHGLFDNVRGATKLLQSMSTGAEIQSDGYLKSFDTDGFGLGGDYALNRSGYTYVSWNFKAAGAAVTNTDGTITSQVSANTEAGFSVVSYTGNGVNGATVGHGLTQTPDIIITKGRSGFDPITNWCVYHSSLGAGTSLFLNSTTSQTAAGNWNSTNPTSNVFSLSSNDANGNGTLFIAYCFAEVEGFSSFGSYVGTDAPNNNILTGFEPAMVIIKSTGATNGDWNIFDNKRNTENPLTDVLKANTSGTETTEPALNISFLENGFSLNGATAAGGRGQINQSGITYIYMAFAADPTTIEPTLEDSFNTVLWTGDAGNTGNTLSKNVTGVGFQPDLVWGKNRDYANNHILFDSVRSPEKWLSSNNTNAESESIYTQATILSDGFTTGTADALNRPNNDFVAWCWKGAELPAINSNGSIPSVVSANPAAGFSIVSWTGNGVIGSTVGHGLTEVPEMIIVKNRTSGSAQWSVYHSAYGATKHTLLNTTDAASTTGDWNNTEPTNSVITFNNSLRTNASGNNYIAYVFHSVAGFSKFGFWQGGTTSINLGFEPAFVLNQDYGAGGVWGMFDSVRGFDKVLAANSSNAEASSAFITPNATGFTVPSESSIVFRLYMAFANQF